MTTWIDVAKVIAPLAPTVGGILGGLIPFPGGALIGQSLGGIIARQFGVPATPEAVANAVAGSPNELAIAKLNAANEAAKIEIEGYARVEEAYARTLQTGIEQTGLTMRAELGHEHWFFTGWRPCAGWLFDIFAAVFGVQLCIAAAQAAFSGDPVPLKTLTDAWPAFLALLGPLALMVGVLVVGRSAEKVKAIETGTTATPPVKSIVNK
jgi:hypothetical protein